jgi:hypothetical protein
MEIRVKNLNEMLTLYREARRSGGRPDNGGGDVTLALLLYVDKKRTQIR